MTTTHDTYEGSQRPTIIGLTGKLGSGKDEVLNRLRLVHGATLYRKASFAELLKVSFGALFDISLDHIEAMKNDESIRISILDTKGMGRDLGRSISFREALQRYGTEAHRDVFDKDFWVTHAMTKVFDRQIEDGAAHVIDVFTDVRFENEAQAILDHGGRVYRVLGYNQDTGDHPSEAGIPDELISGVIDNTFRPDRDEALLMRVHEARGQGEPAEELKAAQRDALAHLDDEISKLHGELQA